MSQTRGGRGTGKKQRKRGRTKSGLNSLDKKKSESGRTKPPKRKPKPKGADGTEEDEKTEKKLAKSPRTTVREKLPKVLVAVMRKANQGSCPHAKLLLDFADADNLPDAKEQKSSESLTELLLSELQK